MAMAITAISPLLRSFAGLDFKVETVFPPGPLRSPFVEQTDAVIEFGACPESTSID